MAMSDKMKRAEWASRVAEKLVKRPVELALEDMEELLCGEVESRQGR